MQAEDGALSVLTIGYAIADLLRIKDIGAHADAELPVSCLEITVKQSPVYLLLVTTSIRAL